MTFIDVTPQEDIDRSRQFAEALQNEAMQFRPVLHPLQGLAQMAQSGVAALLQMRADRQQKDRNAARSAALSSLMGTSTPGITPAVGASPIPSIVGPTVASATPAVGTPPLDLLAGSVAAGPSAPAASAPAPLPGSGLELPALLEIAANFPDLAGAVNPLIQAKTGSGAETFTLLDRPENFGFAPGTVVQQGSRGGFDVLQRPTEAKARTPMTDVGKARADLTAGLITDDEFAAIRGDVLEKEAEKPKRFENADKLRDEFRASSKDFITARDAYGRVLASGEDASAAGDLALIFNYMKVLDPGSVVRESEFATAAATGAFGERIKAAVNRIQTGERLSDEMREDFVDRSGRLFAKQSELQDQLRNEYTRLAGRFDIDPRDVIVDFRSAATQARKESEKDRDMTRPVAPTAAPLVGGMAEDIPPPPQGFRIVE